MLKPHNDGFPSSRDNPTAVAFPYSGEYGHPASSSGMSMCEYFASACDVTAYRPIETFEFARGRKPTVEELAAYITDIRFTEARAMMKVRTEMIEAREVKA